MHRIKTRLIRGLLYAASFAFGAAAAALVLIPHLDREIRSTQADFAVYRVQKLRKLATTAARLEQVHRDCLRKNLDAIEEVRGLAETATEELARLPQKNPSCEELSRVATHLTRTSLRVFALFDQHLRLHGEDEGQGEPPVCMPPAPKVQAAWTLPGAYAPSSSLSSRRSRSSCSSHLSTDSANLRATLFLASLRRAASSSAVFSSAPPLSALLSPPANATERSTSSRAAPRS